jgi:hypothetical protein
VDEWLGPALIGSFMPARNENYILPDLIFRMFGLCFACGSRNAKTTGLGVDWFQPLVGESLQQKHGTGQLTLQLNHTH